MDVAALPPSIIRDASRGQIDLNDPRVTLTLLRANAVIGVTGFFDGGRLSSIGIQCSLCHSTVDDLVIPGVGRRLDGWANRDLDIGKIVALSPNLQPFVDLLGVDDATVRRVLNSWGPGKFDAELVLDGKAFQPDGRSAATLIPPAFGLAGVNLHTWTGWGGVAHWNAFVANLEMHGKGTFFDPRLNDAVKFPIAAANGFDNVRTDAGSHHTKACGAALLSAGSSGAHPPPQHLFDAAAARRGKDVFNGEGPVRHVSRTAALHRAGLEHAHAGRDRHRRLPSEPIARRTLSNRTAQRTVDAHERRLLPRRALPHARSGGRTLQYRSRPCLECGSEARPGAIPENHCEDAVRARWSNQSRLSHLIRPSRCNAVGRRHRGPIQAPVIGRGRLLIFDSDRHLTQSVIQPRFTTDRHQ